MKVLVVGAGIAGLSVAVALQRSGLDVEVVERQDDGEAAGTGLYLPANAERALRSLGLGAAVAARPVDRRRHAMLSGCVHRYRCPFAPIDGGRIT